MMSLALQTSIKSKKKLSKCYIAQGTASCDSYLTLGSCTKFAPLAPGGKSPEVMYFRHSMIVWVKVKVRYGFRPAEYIQDTFRGNIVYLLP